IANWNAAGQQSFNRSFLYDSLNRIASMSQSSGSAQGCGSVFALSWTIDPWGNRTDQNVTAGTCNYFSHPVNRKNQFSNGSYDHAGNLTADQLTGYTFDAENRIVTAANSTYPSTLYVYDADGNRVGKSVGGAIIYYIYSSNGQVVSERDGNNVWNQTY